MISGNMFFMNSHKETNSVKSSPAPNLTDTHAHICDPIFDADRTLVLEKARQAGVACIIAVAENMADAEKNLALAGLHPMIRPAAGLFPTNLDTSHAGKLLHFILRHRDKLAAIGEVGLDYWKVQDESGREVQREIFRGFINLSKDLDLPLNVHSRSAGRPAIDFLLKHSAVKVQLHAFDGKPASALPGVEADYYFSIPPSVVRSAQKQKLVKKLPMTHILIETDSPVLGPTPGDRNEPANVPIVVKTIAELKGLSEAEVLEAVVENTLLLYGK
jgi:TatD DNase family protein